MTIRNLIVVIFGVLIISAAVCQAQNKLMKMTVIFRDGTVVPWTDQNRDFKVYDKKIRIMPFGLRLSSSRVDEKFSMVWNQLTNNIYSIDLMNPNLKPYTKGKMILTKHNGKQTIIKEGTLKYAGINPYNQQGGRFHGIKCHIYNEMEDSWNLDFIESTKIKTIIFGSAAVKINPKTKRMFLHDYKFDPYDGTTLVESH